MKKVLLTILFLDIFSAALFAQSNCWQAKAGRDLMADAVASPSDVAKMNKYDVHFYKLDLLLNDSSTDLSGNASTHALAVADISELVLELHDTLTVDSVWVNGNSKAFTRSGGMISIDPGFVIPAGSHFTMTVFYHGVPPKAPSAAIGNGFSSSKTRKVTWSLSQPFAASEWWPCKQVLTDKADSSEVWITTDTTDRAGSNGTLERTVSLPGGKVRYEWKSRHPIACYLISVTAGQYNEYNAWAHPVGSDSIFIQNYIYTSKNAPASLIASTKAGLDYTPNFIEIFSRVFGLYPFADEKYGHCQVPINGGMEHQTMTSLGAFSFEVVAHELAHQWFGDDVTCGSWADIWLNEGFASYCEYVAYENTFPIYLKPWLNSAMSYAVSNNGSVYVDDTVTVNRIFNSALTYRKGAILLHMMRYQLNNDSLFFLGMREYLTKFRYSNARGGDFRNSMSMSTGKNFNLFFDQWYYGKGHPIFSAAWNQLNNAVYFKLTHIGSAIETPAFNTPVDIRLYHGSTNTTVKVQVDSVYGFYTIPVGLQVDSIKLDPDEWILNEVDTIIHDQTISAVRAINDESGVIVFYPNPASDRLHLIHAEKYSLGVTDIAGREMFTGLVLQQESVIDVTGLKPGVYLLRLTRDDSVRMLKFVKD